MCGRKFLLILAVVWCLIPNLLSAADTYDRKTERVWTIGEGQTTTARFSGLIRNDVLLNVGGSVKRIPLANLSEEDIHWVREVLTREGTIANLPKEYRAKPALDLAAPSAAPEVPPSTSDELPSTKAAQSAAPSSSAPPESADESPPEDAKNGSSDSSVQAPSDAGSEEKPPGSGLLNSRTWSGTGGKKIDARFVAISSEGKEVTLMTDSREERLALSQLSRNDLIWLQDALRDEGRLTEMALPYRDPPDPKLKSADLTKYRKTKYFRKWTLKTGVSDSAQWDHLSQGEVHLIRYENKTAVKIPYRDLSDPDKQYVRDRLQKEIAGELFPAGAFTTMTPEQSASGYQVWTDFDGKQVIGKLIRSDKSQSVNILETPQGEKAYIAAFFSDQDRSTIDGINNPPVAIASNTGNSNAMGPASAHSATPDHSMSPAQRFMEESQQRHRQRQEASRQRMEDSQKRLQEFQNRSHQPFAPSVAHTPSQLTPSMAHTAYSPSAPVYPPSTMPAQPQYREYWYCKRCNKEVSGPNAICSCNWRGIYKMVVGLIMMVVAVIGFCTKSK